MRLTHKIALDPTVKQAEYFARAAGTHRFVWNLALEEWNRQYAAGCQSLKWLARAQRRVLSRRIKGSKNRNKARKRVARIHQRVRNIRLDGLHKLTTRLAKNHGTVVVEDLNVTGMMQNRKLARAIGDVGWRELRQLLAYKSVIYDTRIVVADRWFPSSKRCSGCCAIKESLLLTDRVFACAVCGLTMDRDVNAAINLEQLGRATAEVTPVEMPGGVNEAGTITRMGENS